MGRTCALKPNMERMVAAGTSMSTPSVSTVPTSTLLFNKRGRKERTAVILELQVPDLVDEQRLERCVEERERLEPLEEPG